jgi:hypothetical protein
MGQSVVRREALDAAGNVTFRGSPANSNRDLSMARRAVCVFVALFAVLRAPLPAAPQPPDGVGRLLSRLEQGILAGRPDADRSLLSCFTDPELANGFAVSVIRPRATRAVVRERDRAPLRGTSPGDGYQLTVEAFVESGREATLSTLSLDVRRVVRAGQAGDTEAWAISAQRVLGTVPSIQRLALDESKQFKGRQLVISDEDLEITVPDADVFVSEVRGAPTAMVVLGRGLMRFAPSQPAERGQVKLFAGAEPLVTPVDALFLRFPVGEFERHVVGSLEPAKADARRIPRATEVFAVEAPRSFGLDLGDLAVGSWSLLPRSGDFLAEVRTRKFGTLTYSRVSRDAEDVTLFDRVRGRNISTYASAARLAARGRFYSDDDGADCSVVSYDIDTAFEPGRQWLEGRTRLRLRVVAPSVSTLTLRLADSLAVTSVSSSEYGRLLTVRPRGQNSVIVALPVSASRGAELTLDVAYSGTLSPQPLDQEVAGQADPLIVSRHPPASALRLEDSLLYSNRSYWYPQTSAQSYSTATLRVRVPQGYWSVASGEIESAPASDEGAKSADPWRLFTFVAARPARYFACLITPLVQGETRTVRVGPSGPPDGAPGSAAGGLVRLDVKTSPRFRRNAKSLADSASDVLEYYASIVGDVPYPSITVAAVEQQLPGGHGPAYMAVLNQPVGRGSTEPYRDDPAYFDGFPEFYLAHEIAHQWWGQAVGWKNYHEQWLSEGFAQYFAALYANRARGAGTFDAVMRRFRQWSMDTVGEGPIYLGYRVGHIRNSSRMFRAVVYNKSAAVLHMLRRLMGDDAFFAGLRRFYSTWRFRKAGSDDLRAAMEAESGLDLGRFFERWIYADGVPDVLYSTTVEETGAGPAAVVRFAQVGDVYDIPVTVTVECGGKPPVDVLVKIRDREAEARIPLSGALKKIEINRDSAALGRFTSTRERRAG